MLSPVVTAAPELQATFLRQGYVVVDAQTVAQLAGVDLAALQQLTPCWNDLPADNYLKDGGRYRRRRHSCYSLDSLGQLAAVPHRAHWQPLEYNALHGGMQRWFEPIEAALAQAPAWRALLEGLGRLCTAAQASSASATSLGDWAKSAAASPNQPDAAPWFVEAHQFRIDTTDGIGRPTPEGAHRDGVDFVAVLLIARHAIKGGETRVFEALGPQGTRFTLTQPWSLLLLDDARVIHESTPIQPVEEHGYRDTLVLTFRRHGFQG